MDSGEWVDSNQVNGALKVAIKALESILEGGKKSESPKDLAQESCDALNEIDRIVGNIDWVKLI